MAAATKHQLSLLLFLAFQGCHAGIMLEMLDGMQQLMEGSGEYDREFYNQLVECFDQFDPKLMDSQDAQWQGMLEYANAGGAPGDPWLTCDAKFFEHNCTVQEYGSVPIHEPCNYASNMAFYHTAMEMCKRASWAVPSDYVTALFRTYSFLGQGSSFYHGSWGTLAGGAADGRMNDLWTYVAHQASVHGLEPLDDTIIHELSYSKREKSSIEITEELVDTFLDLPVGEWTDTLNALDMPEIRVGWCGFISTVGILTLTEEEFDALAEWAFANIDGMTDEIYELCIETYTPLVRNATSHVQMSELEKTRLRYHFLATAAKLLYAFVWQEEGLIPLLGDAIFTPEANLKGWELLPVFNDLANTFLNYEYYNPNLQHGIGIYPGEDWCNPTIPHAKWHLEAAIALTDAMFLADEVYEITTKP